VSSIASLPKSSACASVRANVTSIENQVEADQASGSLSKAAHDYKVGAAQIRHDVALFKPSDPVAVAARVLAAQVAKSGRKLAAEARHKGRGSVVSLPEIRTSVLEAACP
jgi:hypothetical protein